MKSNSHTKNKPALQPSFGNTLNNTARAFLSMKRIPLSKSRSKNKGKYFALVDKDDFEYLNKWNWCAIKIRSVIYARRTDSKTKTPVYMHRVIMKVSDKSILIDHKDRNGLNCQKHNLRTCSNGENLRNRKKLPGSTSKYRGVYFYSNKKKWRATICDKNKRRYLGCFKNEIDAAWVYDFVAMELHGEFANLNFSKYY